MGDLDQYRSIVKAILAKYADVRYAYGDIRNELVFDAESDHYLVMSVGWQPVRAGQKPIKRIHGCLLHIDIVEGKLWIQRDGTEHGVAAELVAAGIRQNQIVLGYQIADVRPYTEFAVA